MFSDIYNIVYMVTWNSWSVVYKHLKGTYQSGGGHMAGFGSAIELGFSYLFTLVAILLLVIGFLVFL